MENPMSPAAMAATQSIPDVSVFKQQKIAAWNPAYSREYVVFCLGMVAVMLIPIGAIILGGYDSTPELTLDYGFKQRCKYEDNILVNVSNMIHPIGCPPFDIAFTLSETFPAPVLLYYRLTGFHQNFRRYAKSRNDEQLQGGDVGLSDMKDCQPYDRIGAYRIHPCGAVAWSMFNDSFRLYRTTVNETTNITQRTLICDTSSLAGLSCRKRGIAWPSDREVKYKPIPPGRKETVSNGGVSAETLNVWVNKGWYENEPGHAIPSVVDEDLMVWMKITAMPTFQKAFRYIDIDLTAGTYVIEVQQRYPMSGIGEKAILITSEGWLGVKDITTGVAFEVIGALCVVWATGLLLHQWMGRPAKTSRYAMSPTEMTVIRS